MEQSILYDQYDTTVPPFNEAGSLGYNVVVAKKNISIISTPLPVFACPSSPGGATNRVYDGILPANAGGPGLPPLNLTWKAANCDYTITTGVRGTFANIAYLNNAGGQREGAIQPGGLFGIGSGNMGGMTDGTSNTFLMGERTGGSTIYRRRVIANLGVLGNVNGGGWGDFRSARLLPTRARARFGRTRLRFQRRECRRSGELGRSQSGPDYHHVPAWICER